MKVLILGVNGFIGNALTERILGTTDWSVSGLDIGNTSGADIADSGASVGTLTISDVGTSGTGQPS